MNNRPRNLALSAARQYTPYAKLGIMANSINSREDADSFYRAETEKMHKAVETVGWEVQLLSLGAAPLGQPPET